MSKKARRKVGHMTGYEDWNVLDDVYPKSLWRPVLDAALAVDPMDGAEVVIEAVLNAVPDGFGKLSGRWGLIGEER